MFATSASGLLRVWEAQQRAHPVRRALALLADSCPAPGVAAWQDAPIGARDDALLRLQAHLFGTELRTTVRCPGCDERLESEFSVDQIRIEPPRQAEDAFRLCWHDYEIDYRLPTSADLLHVMEQRHDAGDPVRALLRRCVRRARQGALDIDSGCLPDEVVACLDAAMAAHDAAADVHAALCCPACGTRWQSHFDVVSYLWSELDDWALRTLADVHALARAYGWSEEAILALSPVRRRLYLDMVGA
jgi:hypothetical protein